jgi:hypothetical protein
MVMTTSLALPPPGTGDCIMTQHSDPETGTISLTIDHADPIVLIAAEVLRRAGWPSHAQVRLADVIPYEDIYLGATILIVGTTRTVIYRITRRHDEHTYVGEWPD